MNKQGKNMQARVGYLQDWYRLMTFRFENPHSWMKYRQIAALQKKTGATGLVETGTYLGVTTARAARHFSKVYTVELDPVLCAKAGEYLKQWPQVEVIEGDGLVELPKCLERFDATENVMVFLDGHFSGSDTTCGDHPEPACLEIEAMQPYVDRIHGVIVDDFRLFGIQEGYPKKSELLSTVEKVFPETNFQTSVQFDQLVIQRKP